MIDIIGVPLDLGASRRGVDMGPSAIRYAGLKAALDKLSIPNRDLGNIEVPVAEITEVEKAMKMKHFDEINEVNSKLFSLVQKSVQNGHKPLVLGGDHSLAVGSILGVQSVLKNIGVIWFDAHGDCNTEDTSPSGNMHGMPLAACSGRGARAMAASFLPKDINYIDEESIVLVGVRDLDEGEIKVLSSSKITVFTIEDIDMLGMKEVMKQAIEIASRKTKGIHLSFDMDVMNPQEAPGVGTPATGGLTYREAHLALEMIAQTNLLTSLEFVEINPILDHGNQTGQLAVSLIESALGKRIFRRH